MKDYRIPVTLLTGFLGAGKTTLLNAVLRDPSASRIAVIVNEFGEAGIDHDLIETSCEDIVLMSSGCLCCTIRSDLADTMVSLFARRNAGELAFDRVVIETTGLADPGPILQTMTADPWLKMSFRVDGVVTVADAAAGPATMDRQFEAVAQAAIADLIVVSKTDLAPPDAARAFEARLRELNPTAGIIRWRRGEAAPNALWGLSALRHDAAPAQALSWLSPREAEPADPLANLSGLAPAGSGAKAKQTIAMSPHDARIGAASIVVEAPISEDVFDIWLDCLIALRGPDILRVKGVVHLEGIDTPFAFHGVQHIFDPPVPLRDWPKDDRRSRVVVIARDIASPDLQRNLERLRRAPLDAAGDPTSKDAFA